MEQTRRQAGKKWRRAQLRAVVAEAASSGMAIRQLCERDHISDGHFHHWRHWLELEDRAESQKGTGTKPEAQAELASRALHERNSRYSTSG